MNKLSIFSLLSIFLCLACSSVPAQGLLSAQNLAGRSFSLVMVDGQEFSSEYPRPFIVFDEKLGLTGKFCNHFVGQASLRGNILSVPGMASTRMLCGEESLNQLEMWFGQMLVDGAQISLDGPLLIIQSQEHNLEFEERDR